MKTIVMMRGPQAERTEMAKRLLAALNTDVDNVRGFMIQASDWLGRGRTTEEDEAAAYTTCKNYLKKFMTHMNESVLIVNNPNEKPDTWRSYRSICGKFDPPQTDNPSQILGNQSRFIGIDLGESPDQFKKELDETFNVKQVVTKDTVTYTRDDGTDFDFAKFAERFSI